MTEDKLQPEKISSFKSFWRLSEYFKPYKKEIFLSLLALLVTAVMILFFGKAIKYLIDLGFVEKSIFMLSSVLLVFIAAVSIMAVAGYYRSLLINSTTERVIADIRKKIYRQIINVSAEFFEITKTGDVITRLTADLIIINNAISNTIFFALRNTILLVGSIIFLFLTSPKLMLISVALIPLTIAPILIMGKMIKTLSQKTQTAVGNVSSHIEETMSGIKTIQSYLCEEREYGSFSNYVDNALEVTLERIKVKSMLIALVISLAFGAVMIVLWFGGNQVLNGTITSGDLSSFVFYSVITATSLVSLSQITGSLQSASASCNRIFELLNIESVVREPLVAHKFEHSNQVEIAFRNIAFSYPSRKDVLILNDFNLTIKPQEKVAILGLSGSGKSTILQLLMRFYDVTKGEIAINNNNIKNLSFQDLRHNFSYISQDCFIFSGTIFENIAYAARNVTKEEVKEIIKNNESLSFIEKLPNGIDSEIGQKGIQLSGGERQRIAIARAIIKDSPVLLLDEATSALDNQNEKSIVDAIAKISHNKTVITVAHKLSAIEFVDKIVFIHDGKISQIGSHEELIATNDLYRKMYRAKDYNVKVVS